MDETPSGVLTNNLTIEIMENIHTLTSVNGSLVDVELKNNVYELYLNKEHFASFDDGQRACTAVVLMLLEY